MSALSLNPGKQLLARVRHFLPLLASSNEDLLQRAKENPSAVDIENTAGQDKVIEMDLGLGVFDVQGAAKGDMGPELDIPEDQEGAEDEDEDDEDEDEDEDMEEGSETDSSSSDSDSSPSTADSTPQPPR
ncbi:uncharacterized protein MKK02DRAFT_41430 [Dioszegia hungarica]|uniref:Uncharacterized protein n=1 Tax=Dioszegia hungarica TaxID=4972 RepID=A0AA38GZM8_9TREE|nr:uncharacterized protein MKK02DRAFT_41430 [Dioszegia hungarica]KAI9631802.1 hypothetical protein MKK02DRAFT_41430 [Dioszegia hungarica]